MHTEVTEWQEKILSRIIEIESSPVLNDRRRGQLAVLYKMLARSEEDQEPRPERLRIRPVGVQV